MKPPRPRIRESDRETALRYFKARALVRGLVVKKAKA